MTIAYTDQPGLIDYIQAQGQWIAEINGMWYTSDDAAVTALIAGFVPPAPPVPTIVSMRQARLALLAAGMLTTVDNAVAAMTGTAGQEAQVEWGYAPMIDRSSPLVASMAGILNLTSAQLDSLFTAAIAL